MDYSFSADVARSGTSRASHRVTLEILKHPRNDIKIDISNSKDTIFLTMYYR